MRTITAHVSGRVQQVGFRYSTVRAAQAFGIVGWVRNRPDGTVEVWAQGSEDAVAEMISFLEAGPIGAKVSRCIVTEESFDPQIADFTVRY